MLLHMSRGFRMAGERGDLTPIQPFPSFARADAVRMRLRAGPESGEMERVCAALQLVIHAFQREEDMQ